MKIYQSYMFRGKDPAIDELRTVIQDAHKGKLTGSVLTKIAQDGGPSTGATRGWFFGKTRRPQNATLEAAGRACGYRRKWVPDR